MSEVVWRMSGVQHGVIVGIAVVKDLVIHFRGEWLQSRKASRPLSNQLFEKGSVPRLGSFKRCPWLFSNYNFGPCGGPEPISFLRPSRTLINQLGLASSITAPPAPFFSFYLLENKTRTVDNNHMCTAKQRKMHTTAGQSIGPWSILIICAGNVS